MVYLTKESEQSRSSELETTCNLQKEKLREIKAELNTKSQRLNSIFQVQSKRTDLSKMSEPEKVKTIKQALHKATKGKTVFTSSSTQTERTVSNASTTTKTQPTISKTSTASQSECDHVQQPNPTFQKSPSSPCLYQPRSRKRKTTCKFNCEKRHTHATAYCQEFDVLALDEQQYLEKLLQHNPDFYNYLKSVNGLEKFYQCSRRKAEKRVIFRQRKTRCHMCQSTKHWTNQCHKNRIDQISMESWFSNFRSNNEILFNKLKISNSLLSFYQKCVRYSFPILRIV